MESSTQQTPVIFLILLVVFLAGAGWFLFSSGSLYGLIRSLRRRLLPQQQHARQILEKAFVYYRQLSAADKQGFEIRVAEFLADKEFVPRGGLLVTEETKTLVAACAVQLTFGLPLVRLRHFSKIILYPDAYFSTVNREYHLGEVNAAGAIVLSWKHFMEGYLVPNDSLNVGLHEMAHALLIENRTRYDGEYDFLDATSLKHFLECAEAEHMRMQRGESGLLRKYAQTSPAEFFSVAVEVFFENPEMMATQAPDLYEALKDLLKQDPLRLQFSSRT